MLDFENKVRAFVQVNAALGDGAVQVAELDGLFEDIGVVVFVGAGRGGARNLKEVAELGVAF